jgi:CheY-like chemotaxis protein
MSENIFLVKKRVLIVDDEPDVLDTLEELLTVCDVERAENFDTAWDLLGTKYYDLAILDIMGVDGYRLLSLANERDITAVILTAHALSTEDVKKSFKGGAAYYIPKDEMANIATYLDDVLEAKEKGKSSWGRWLDRFSSFFINRFGPAWQEEDKEFWRDLKY